MAGKKWFTDETPEVEIRSGMVYISPGGAHGDVATTPHVLRAFVERSSRVLAEWEAEQRPPVDLPKGKRARH